MRQVPRLNGRGLTDQGAGVSPVTLAGTKTLTGAAELTAWLGRSFNGYFPAREHKYGRMTTLAGCAQIRRPKPERASWQGDNPSSRASDNHVQ